MCEKPEFEYNGEMTFCGNLKKYLELCGAGDCRRNIINMVIFDKECRVIVDADTPPYKAREIMQRVFEILDNKQATLYELYGDYHRVTCEWA